MVSMLYYRGSTHGGHLMPGAAEYQRSKTHCPQGHPYDEANTKHTSDGRACRTCHRERSRKKYAASGAAGRAKAAAYGREIRRRRDPKYLAARLARREKARQWLATQKFACIKCGESNAACLDFHHRDPKEKDFQIGYAVCTERKRQRVLMEIAKCEVLCANCHRKHHYDERQEKLVGESPAA
jgi:hypothetical protein